MGVCVGCPGFKRDSLLARKLGFKSDNLLARKLGFKSDSLLARKLGFKSEQSKQSKQTSKANNASEASEASNASKAHITQHLCIEQLKQIKRHHNLVKSIDATSRLVVVVGP